MKRVLWPGALILLMALLVVGCGVSQEEYDRQVSEAQTEIARRDTEIESLTTQLDAATLKIDTAYLKMEIAAELYGPVFSGEGLDDPDLVQKLGDMVAEVGDEAIQKYYDDWAASPGDTDLAYDLLTYLFERIVADMSE